MAAKTRKPVQAEQQIREESTAPAQQDAVPADGILVAECRTSNGKDTEARAGSSP